MSIQIRAGQIGHQTVVETLHGNMVQHVGSLGALSPQERDKAIEEVLQRLLVAIEGLPDTVVSTADKTSLKSESRALIDATMPKAEKSKGVESFFSTLRKCFGDAASIATLAINLGRLIG
jgi:hypothetical protein